MAVQQDVNMTTEENDKSSQPGKVVLEQPDHDSWITSNYVKIGVTVFVTFAVCILFFFMLFRIDEIMDVLKSFIKSGESIIIGLVLAYLLNPVEKYIEMCAYKVLKKSGKNDEKIIKTSRGIGVFGAILFLLIIVSLLIAAIVPAVINSVVSLVDTLPGQVQSFVRMLRKGFFGDTELTKNVTVALMNITNYLEDWATNTLLPEAQTYITHITSGVISVVKSVLNFIIGIIVAVYVLTIKETLTGQSKKILYAAMKPKRANIVIEIVRKTDEIFGGFITGKLLDSAIIGVICYIGCSILRIPSSILIAVVIGVTNIIPFFGPIIGAIPCLLLVIVQSPIHALYLLVFILVLQQVDGNIIGPKILGDSTGLSSFWVMFAILIFGGKFGFFGMLLGVPVMGVIYYLVRRIVNYGVRKRGLSDKTGDYVYAEYVDIKTNRLIHPEEKEQKGKSKKKKMEDKTQK